MKNFFKKYIQKYSLSSLYNDTHELVIQPRQLNWILSGLLLFGLTSFIAGYFWGQKKAVEYFIKRIEEDSFADRISYALYTMNDRDSLEFEESDNDTNQTSDGDDDQLENSENIDTNSESTDDSQESTDGEEDIILVTEDILQKSPLENVIEEVDIPVSKITVMKTSTVPVERTVYVARLAGFGTLQAARDFLRRIKPLDNGANAVEHVSKTSKGRKIKWYQVVTSEFEDKKALTHLVERIKHKEHINDVQIIDRKKGA